MAEPPGVHGPPLEQSGWLVVRCLESASAGLNQLSTNTTAQAVNYTTSTSEASTGIQTEDAQTPISFSNPPDCARNNSEHDLQRSQPYAKSSESPPATHMNLPRNHPDKTVSVPIATCFEVYIKDSDSGQLRRLVIREQDIQAYFEAQATPRVKSQEVQPDLKKIALWQLCNTNREKPSKPESNLRNEGITDLKDFERNKISKVENRKGHKQNSRQHAVLRNKTAKKKSNGAREKSDFYYARVEPPTSSLQTASSSPKISIHPENKTEEKVARVKIKTCRRQNAVQMVNESSELDFMSAGASDRSFQKKNRRSEARNPMRTIVYETHRQLLALGSLV